MGPGPVFTKEKRKEMRNELEDLLRGYSGGPAASDTENVVDDELSEIAAAPPLDFVEMNRKFEEQAKGITDSLMKFYVDLGVIDSVEYVDQKRKLDNTNIQNIFFQLKTIKFALEKITEEINQGNTHPRLFEVFGQLQDKFTTVIKTQANYVLFLEDTYKKMNQDISQRGLPAANGSVTPLLKQPDEYYITAGTKNIMKEITVEEVVEKDDQRFLTHPSKRVEVMEEKGVPNTVLEVDEDDLSEDVNSMV